MVEQVVNTVYLLVIFVYYWPFIAVQSYGVMNDQGMIETVPEWVYDTTWRGFLLSPYRLVKGLFHG
jgi:hypothetical protein